MAFTAAELEEMRRANKDKIAESQRAKGFRISPARIRDGLESGAYPLWRIVSVGVTGRKNTEIFRVMFEAWIREVCGEEIEKEAKQ